MNCSSSGFGYARGAPMGHSGSHVYGSVDISVPRACVRVVIGENGEMIKNIQLDVYKRIRQDVCIQFKPDDGTSPERLCTVTGSPDSIIMATSFIRNLIVQTKGSYGPECGSSSSQPMSSLGSNVGSTGVCRGSGGYQGEVSFPVSAHKSGDEFISEVKKAIGSVDISVPRAFVGVIIEKSGDMTKKIQELNVRIQFKPDDQGTSPERLCTITGTPDSIIMATSLIRNLISQAKESCGPGGESNSVLQDRLHSNKLGRTGTGGTVDSPGGSEVHYAVPTVICGAVIGSGGESIREIQRVSGARVQLSKAPPPNPAEKMFIIQGRPVFHGVFTNSLNYR